MLASLRKEVLYGGRALLRDNYLSRRLMWRLVGQERLAPEALQDLQHRLLRRSMQAAVAALPYYRHIRSDFSAAEAPQALRELFPVIDKPTLLQQPAALYPHGGRKRVWEAWGKTSGTTGSPLTIIRSMASVQMEQAFIKRHWTWGGFHDGMRRASLRGDLVAAPERRQPPFWFYNRYNQQLLLSSRHLNEACVDAIIDELERFAPAMLQAYPSTAYTLAQFLQRRGRRLRIPVLFSASEPLYPHQQELIEQWLAPKIMDMYGMAERVAFATQCEHGETHINPDYSYVEILDEQGRPTEDYGHIVGTTFHNLSQPLLRYRLSDRSRWKPGQCRCGRPFPMIESVTGKLEDAITGGDGAFVSPSVLTFAFKGVQHIRKSQVAQTAPGQWEIRLVPDAGFSAADSELLLRNIRELVDATVQARVVLRDELPNTAAGKFRWVVNESPRSSF
ncbi:phenylacetate--CoA ligase family protein [Pseudoduganella violacea]|uniref:Phenylacetate-CoA ligase n=1 Tax=Pseudoduganella violacea TaxID=1715466 RepID=A0A7W5BAM1_9BURK|nr:phenylacetate--CoA ligase family protein [Pseudoduganella violacea]MBB3119611.1 phenylacetate-CoA ligase [Pseudoduganella violacea]